MDGPRGSVGIDSDADMETVLAGTAKLESPIMSPWAKVDMNCACAQTVIDGLVFEFQSIGVSRSGYAIKATFSSMFIRSAQRSGNMLCNVVVGIGKLNGRTTGYSDKNLGLLQAAEGGNSAIDPESGGIGGVRD